MTLSLHVQSRTTPSATTYDWLLLYGPDGIYEYSGNSASLREVFAAVEDACLDATATLLGADLTHQSHPTPAHPPLHPHTPHIHTPEGDALPAQQNLPSLSHTPIRASSHLLPSGPG